MWGAGEIALVFGGRVRFNGEVMARGIQSIFGSLVAMGCLVWAMGLNLCAESQEVVLEFPAVTGPGATRGVPGSERTTFRPGLLGPSAVFDETTSLELPLKGGCWPAEGTLDFWIKPDWDPAEDDVERAILSVGGAKGLAVVKTADGRLALVAEGAVPAVSASIALEWRRHEWSHATLTWSGKEAAVHLHGRLRTRATLERPLLIPQADRVVLGAGMHGKSGLQAAVERLRLRPRVIPLPELRQEIAPGILALPENNDVRLWLRGGANGRPVRFLVDTGASFSALFRDSALLTHLTLAPAPAGAPPSIRQVAQFDLTLDGVAQRGMAELPILDKPFQSAEEGLYGWHSLREQTWTIDWEMRDIIPAAEEATSGPANWTTLPLIPDSRDCLVDQAQLQIGDTVWKCTVLIDTGDTGGLGFSPALWKKAAPLLETDDHSIEGAFNPISGFHLTHRYVTNRLSLFGHTLRGVSAGQTWVDDSAVDRPGTIDLYIGLAALSYFDCVFDGAARQLRVRPRPAPAARESLNRSGLVLLPIDPESPELRCHVLENSPAWKLGFRDGDIPLILDGRPMPDWRTTPPRSLAYQQRISAGEAIRFTVRRQGERVEIPRAEH